MVLKLDPHPDYPPEEGRFMRGSDFSPVAVALKALFFNGIDKKKKISGTNAPHPFLFNVPVEFVERFRKQVTLLTCVPGGSGYNTTSGVVVLEKPVKFGEYTVHNHTYPLASRYLSCNDLKQPNLICNL